MDVADESMQITSRRSSTKVAANAAAAAGLPPHPFFLLVLFICPLQLRLGFVPRDSAAGGKEEKPTLTIDVLMHALRQKGVNIYKPSIIKVLSKQTHMTIAFSFIV